MSLESSSRAKRRDHSAPLVGECPFAMYERLCAITGRRHDPCVIDVFMSITRFMAGEAPRPWWEYTATRKALWVGE